MPKDVLEPNDKNIEGKGDIAKDDNLFTATGNEEHSGSNTATDKVLHKGSSTNHLEFPLYLKYLLILWRIWGN